jgi:hypothetical protein
MPSSRYCIVIDNLSSQTRSKDIRYEAERAGKVLEVVRDPKHRCALVEFDRWVVETRLGRVERLTALCTAHTHTHVPLTLDI